MPVATQQRVQQTQENTLPKGKAPPEGQTPNAENGHELASSGGAHDFSVHHTEPTSPKEQFCEAEKKERYTQQLTLPSVKDGPVRSAYANDHSGQKREACQQRRHPQRKHAKHKF